MKWFKHNAMASYADDLVLIRTELGFAGLGVYWQMMEMLSLHRGRCSMQLILSLKCKAFSAQKIRRVIELATALTEDQLGFLCLAKDEQDANRESCPDFAQSVFSEQNSPRRARIEENREIEKEKEEAEEEKPAADDDFSKEKSPDTGRDSIDRVRKWLLDERNRVWRERLHREPASHQGQEHGVHRAVGAEGARPEPVPSGNGAAAAPALRPLRCPHRQGAVPGRQRSPR